MCLIRGESTIAVVLITKFEKKCLICLQTFFDQSGSGEKKN